MQLRKFTDAADEAQRVRCELNTKPALSQAERAVSLFYAMELAKLAGRLDEAREYARELKPLVEYLPEAK